MSMIYLGETIDVHTGGVDHIPIHHTNEIAQSETATGKQFVRLWLHHEFLTIDGKKMAKSLGNIITLSDIVKEGINPLSFRYWLLTGHYRTLLNFTWEALRGAETALSKIYDLYKEFQDDSGTVSEEYKTELIHAISDDLDFPRAIALLWRLLKDDSVKNADKKATLLLFDTVLGIGLSDLVPEKIPDDVMALVRKREQARKEKDWGAADLLREEIEKKGYFLRDTDDGPRLKSL